MVSNAYADAGRCVDHEEILGVEGVLADSRHERVRLAADRPFGIASWIVSDRLLLSVTAARCAACRAARRSAVSHTCTVGGAVDVTFARYAAGTTSGVDAWAGLSAIAHMKAVVFRKRLIGPVLNRTTAAVVDGAPRLSRVAGLSKRGAWRNQGAGQAGRKREHCK
jgi:hypothetical protein